MTDSTLEPLYATKDKTNVITSYHLAESIYCACELTEVLSSFRLQFAGPYYILIFKLQVGYGKI